MKISLKVSLLVIIGLMFLVSLGYAKNLVKIWIYNPSSKKLIFSEVYKPWGVRISFPEGKIIKPKEYLPIDVNLGIRKAAFITLCFKGEKEKWCADAGPRRGDKPKYFLLERVKTQSLEFHEKIKRRCF